DALHVLEEGDEPRQDTERTLVSDRVGNVAPEESDRDPEAPAVLEEQDPCVTPPVLDHDPGAPGRLHLLGERAGSAQDHVADPQGRAPQGEIFCLPAFATERTAAASFSGSCRKRWRLSGRRCPSISSTDVLARSGSRTTPSGGRSSWIGAAPDAL